MMMWPLIKPFLRSAASTRFNFEFRKQSADFLEFISLACENTVLNAHKPKN